MSAGSHRCDIFCRVVDNYGDIGVCWRLARQLVAEAGWQVRLFVDDLISFQRIAPGLAADLELQQNAGVEVVRWSADSEFGTPAALVIEAFACEIPEVYQAAMAQMPRAPVWINLEYLSAESWVESHHLLPSPHPRRALTKYFFLPGFTAGTGGVLREGAVQVNASPNASRSADAPLNLFVFCYDTGPVEGLARGARQAGIQLRVHSPVSAVLTKLQHWRGSQANCAREGAPMLEVAHADFVPQEAFDAVLSRHDVLIVRGEDSFVRAQWAAKPFVWHIYPQADGAHRIKLDAFLDLYCAQLAPAAASALRSLWASWNAGDADAVARDWVAFLKERKALETHATQWAQQLAAMPDLVSNLLSFFRKIAKI